MCCAHLHAFLCMVGMFPLRTLAIQDCSISDRCRDPVQVKEGIDMSRIWCKIC